jgi:hypothetical protein
VEKGTDGHMPAFFVRNFSSDILWSVCVGLFDYSISRVFPLLVRLLTHIACNDIQNHYAEERKSKCACLFPPSCSGFARIFYVSCFPFPRASCESLLLATISRIIVSDECMLKYADVCCRTMMKSAWIAMSSMRSSKKASLGSKS